MGPLKGQVNRFLKVISHHETRDLDYLLTLLGRATYPPNYTLKPLPERGLVPLERPRKSDQAVDSQQGEIL